ncbi:MAG TPA: SRPBCC domain-containing protein [Caulobacteraceae bacterium]|nr:SRPBCC domain-containing protein [Caulobacteraceae bacterium]
MIDEANTVVVETDIEAPPERVWQAFSEPELSAAWLPPGEMSTEPGDRFTLDDDGRRIDCEVLEAEPARRLRLGWRETDGGLPSEVSFVLTPTPAGGTHLKVVHGPVVVSLASARPRAALRLQRPALTSVTSLRLAA